MGPHPGAHTLAAWTHTHRGTPPHTFMDPLPDAHTLMDPKPQRHTSSRTCMHAATTEGMIMVPLGAV